MKHLRIVVATAILFSFSLRANGQDTTFHVKYRFEDFPSKVWHGKPAPINWKSNPRAWRAYNPLSGDKFRDEIHYAVKRGPNFAGHYAIATMGCGSPCQTSVIIDLKNGRISHAIGTCTGMDFRCNSRLVVIDGRFDSTRAGILIADNYSICSGARIYEWRKNRLHLLYETQTNR